jgi:hypothetical protein
MDIGLQVSLSESFNIVSAGLCKVRDAPIVTSDEVSWNFFPFSRQRPTDSESIVKVIDRTLFTIDILSGQSGNGEH